MRGSASGRERAASFGYTLCVDPARPTEFRFGDLVGGFEVHRANIAIDEVLKGEPQTLEEGQITLQVLPFRDRDGIAELMPTHQHLLFLHYVPWFLERLGQPEWEQERELYDYVVRDERVVLDIDGIARALDPRNPDRFPVRFEGDAFEAVVADTRRAVQKFLAFGDEEIDLEPLPPELPPGLSEAEAVAIAVNTLAGIGGTDRVLYVEHGLGVAQFGQPPEPVWVVIVASDPTPHPGGPPCELEATCPPAMIVGEMAGAVVSDSTRAVARMFSRGHVL